MESEPTPIPLLPLASCPYNTYMVCFFLEYHLRDESSSKNGIVSSSILILVRPFFFWLRLIRTYEMAVA